MQRKLRRYVRQYDKQPKPVQWKHFDTTRRITPDSTLKTQFGTTESTEDTEKRQSCGFPEPTQRVSGNTRAIYCFYSVFSVNSVVNCFF